MMTDQQTLPGFDEACDRAELAQARKVLAEIGVPDHVLDFFETGEVKFLNPPKSAAAEVV